MGRPASRVGRNVLDNFNPIHESRNQPLILAEPHPMTNFESLVLLLGCKATLILGLVAGLFALTARRWPRNCILWQRLGVIALLALPVAAWASPTLGIPVLSVTRPMTAADEAELPWQPSTGAGAEMASRQNGSADPRDVLPGAGASAANSVPSARHGLATTKLSVVNLCLAAAYGVVVVVLVIRFVRAWQGLAQLRRASSLVVDPAWQATLEHWSAELQVGRPVELRMSDTVSVPMTFSWRPPVILIPGDCLATCDQNLRDAIVVHELTHIAQGDFFWQAMTRLAAAMYWMHPLVWLIGRQDRVLCERICDALCSQQLTRESYARSLVRIAGRKILRPAAALGIAMARASSLRRRLTDLYSGTPSRYACLNRTQRVLLGGTAGLILGLIVVGTVTARAAPEGRNDEQPPATSPQKSHPDDNSTKAAPVAPVRLPATIEGQVLDQQNNPLAGADVNLIVEGEHPNAEGATAPHGWIATTDDQGRYRLDTGAPSLDPANWLRLSIHAEGFAVLSNDFELKDVQGTFPVQRLYAGRTIIGRIVDPQGTPVASATVRFQASTEDLKMLWDSGPQAVDERGTFSVSIPQEGRAAGVIYPRGLAPQFVDVPEKQNDLGVIRVQRGTAIKGRVVDKEGRGVAGTVVGLQSEEHRLLFLFGVLIGTAVKTDDNGGFLLPPVRGTYRILVSDGISDYSRQCYLRGATPPPILPQRIELSGEGKMREVILREAGSVTVRGTVRRDDGSPMPNVDITASFSPAAWKSAVNLGSVRTDSEGAYVLRLPATAQRMILSVHHVIEAHNGTFQHGRPVGQGAEVGDFNFDGLTADQAGVDWWVGSTR
jgi:beta-lactamase regulating signal transducer with metallopeptidase domain